MTLFTPRPNQQDILAYTRGMMGISAVPGSGKTETLSRLAAQLIASGEALEDDQEVLIVTLTNSAVENFKKRISAAMGEWDMLSIVGYRVRTLHGLAHDIVRERPDLAGLTEDFRIMDEREAADILGGVVQSWLHTHAEMIETYLDPELPEFRLRQVHLDKLPELVGDLALSFIRSSKDMQLTPGDLQARLQRTPVPLPLAEMGAALYSDYQRALTYRGAVDFDDLIRLALKAVETDDAYLRRLRQRWPFILEDEAQDSSRLQERILRKLAGEGGNWVRVGDPNQAIYETFTTANPRFLRDFIREAGVMRRELPDSGRSSASVLRIANHLIDWVQQEHPIVEVRDALAPPYIRPTPPGDPQPNPPDQPGEVFLWGKKMTAEEELDAIGRSLERWLPEHPADTVAVIAPTNRRGLDLVEELTRRRIPYVDSLMQSSSSTRAVGGLLEAGLSYLAQPNSPRQLAQLFKHRYKAERVDRQRREEIDRAADLIGRCVRLEDYLWPRPDRDWLETLASANPDTLRTDLDRLMQFREDVRRWQGAILLPVDQIMLTLAQDFFSTPDELALAYRFAVAMGQASDRNPEWRLPQLAEELNATAGSDRLLGFGKDNGGFDPKDHAGQVVVATIHKAKGLEWDRVYLLSVNSYDFPAGDAEDWFMAEKEFIRGRLNLPAEAIDQLKALDATDEYTWYQEGQATLDSRLDYVRERLRLLYVGLTRAKKSLVVTWNTGRRGDQRQARAFEALQAFWEEVNRDRG